MEGTVHVLDDYYLSITLLITIAYQLFFFSIAFTFKFDKLTGKLTSSKAPPIYQNMAGLRLFQTSLVAPTS